MEGKQFKLFTYTSRIDNNLVFKTVAEDRNTANGLLTIWGYNTIPDFDEILNCTFDCVEENIFVATKEDESWIYDDVVELRGY